MSTYYEYQDVKVMIAHELMKREGWTVYGYHKDRSDLMTDYYCPASWDGVAEKNGYVFCVDVYGAEEASEIKKYTNAGAVDHSIYEKIEKLQELTVEHGATESEAASAKKRIETLQNKLAEQQEKAAEYVVTGIIPGHMAHPPKCNWHVEKDGVIILKGNGILKYAAVENYFSYNHYAESLKAYKENKEKFVEDTAAELYNKGYYDKENAQKQALNKADEMEKACTLVDKFLAWLNKIDMTCGAMIGNADEVVTYEKVVKTEYKTELKAFETEHGSIKEGQCFILKRNFNYGCYKGLVYRIHEREYSNGTKYFTAYKLNKKLTKECTGMASANNRFNGFSNGKFLEWIDAGYISWCELREVQTPYEVEKVVKKVVKNNPLTTSESLQNAEYTYSITPDIDTRDESKIWVVKIKEKLSKDEYKKAAAFMGTLGGYYSRFKHGFIFRCDPSDILSGQAPRSAEQPEAPTPPHAVQGNDKLMQSIDKQIASLQKKIDALSGDYKTNTYKRMQEEHARQEKRDKYRIDINILNYIKHHLQDGKTLTPLENALVTGTFRADMQKFYNLKYEYTREISYPEIAADSSDYWKTEAEKEQKRLLKAEITNTAQLVKAVEEFKIIFETVQDIGFDKREREIKNLTDKYKLQQKGDIQFTDAEIAADMVKMVNLSPDSKVLEPSAGIGNIADEIRKVTPHVDCIEIVPSFCELLEMKGYNVVGNDFLEFDNAGYYDAIIMNPPFSNNQDIAHLQHAYKLVKNGGVVICITSNHWTFASDKKSAKFREWIAEQDYFTIPLPNGSFEMTNIVSQIVLIKKKEQTGKQTSEVDVGLSA